jgi:hypothetical protein
MAFTAKQTSDINNSMVALQNVGLGSIIADLVGTTGSGVAFISGSARPDKQRYPVDTGLTTVTAAFATISASPTHTVCTWVSAIAGSTAGDILLQSWIPTATGDVTPKASAGSATDQFPWIYWLAVGT